MEVPTRVRSVEAEQLVGGRYEVLSPIGAGSAARVFRVQDLRTGATRAAKVLRPENAGNPEILARFEDEFRILRTLHHPHLPEVYDYGATAGGGRFLVMELVDGVPLDEYFRAHPEDIWVILYELCETLVFLHARNLLHQDIKPSNILVKRAPAPDGERPLVKLIDFGLTYRRGTGAAVRLVGTAEYIAPEVARGEKTLNRAVDYYSLGATLFELLCGAPPFVGSESEVLRAHVEQEPFIEREELEWAELYPHVRALLAKSPDARLVAFEEFRRAIVGRLTGGIEDLDRAYALARIDSLGMIGKKAASEDLAKWLSTLRADDEEPLARTVSVSGGEGVGKRYLVGALRAEAATRGVRTLTPAEITDGPAETAFARQPALMWARLLEMCEKEPVILVVERPETLPDEERSFVRLAGTQWELTRSRGRVLPLFFLVAVDSTTDDADVLDYLPSESAKKIELAALTAKERDEIVTEFRGAMFDSRDARALSTYLGRFEDAGSAIQGLHQAVLRSALTFTGQRWKVQPSLLSEIVSSQRDQSYSRDLVASLSVVERRIAAMVAAHPQPVPIAWVAAFVDVSPTVLTMVVGSMKRLCVASSEKISPTTASVREALRAGGEPRDLRQAHEFLVSKLVSIESRSVAEDRALAHHHEQLGSVRDAARVHVRLLRTYWAVRPRERPYELIEGVCRSGLELLATHGKSAKVTTRRHLFCFYLKEWIKALWARNLFTQAKPIIDEWTARLGETMPASVAPRYVRAVLELEGPAAALAHISGLTSDKGPSRQLVVRLELERALAIHNEGNYQKALDGLDSISDDTCLSTRDRYRLQVYRLMNLDEVHGMSAIQALIDSLAEAARLSGCVDEAVLMYALKARSYLGSGRLEAALREISLGLRIAHRNGLLLRENLLYRLAASAYGDMNSVLRASVCQHRALQVAGVLGIGYLAGTSWGRLAYNECALGRFGNAVSYGARAVELVREGAPERDMSQAYFALYAALVLSRTDIGKDRLREISHRAESAAGQNERGYFHMWHGRALVFEGKLADALHSFRQAQEDFMAAGFPINAAWARLREARIHLHLFDYKSFVESMGRVRTDTGRGAPRLIQLDFRVVELKGCYVFRKSPRSILRLASECEMMLESEPDVPLKIEMLETLFRVYARCGRPGDAERSFARFRELVSGVLANSDSKHAQAIAEGFTLGAIIDEYRLVGHRKRERGTSYGPPSTA